MFTLLAQTQPSTEDVAQLWVVVLSTVAAILGILLVVTLTWSIMRGRRIRRELRDKQAQRRREELVAQGSLGSPPRDDPAAYYGPPPTPESTEPWQAAGQRVEKPNDGPAEPGSDTPNPPWAKQENLPFDVPPWEEEDVDDEEEEDDEDEKDNWWKRGEEPPY